MPKRTSVGGTSVVVVAAPPADAAPHPRAHQELRHQHHCSDERRDDRAEQHVAVEHVRELVADHAFELDAVHRREQALGDRDRGVLGVSTGRERVRRLLGHHVDAGLRDARGDRESLDEVVQARLVLGGHLARPRRREHQPVAVEVGADREHGRRRRARSTRPVDTGAEDVAERDADEAEEDERADHEQHRLPLVRRDLLVHLLVPPEVDAHGLAHGLVDVEERSLLEPERVRRRGSTGTCRSRCSAAGPGRCRTAGRRRSSTRCRRALPAGRRSAGLP